MQNFENAPTHESMRDSHKGTSEYNEICSKCTKQKKDYRIIDRKLKRSINQNYDNVYSWLCNKFKSNPDFGYLKRYFLDSFIETAQTINKSDHAEYKLDENKKVIKNE